MICPGIQLVKILEKIHLNYVPAAHFIWFPTFSSNGHCEQSSLATGFNDGSMTKLPSPWISPSVFFDFFALCSSPRTSEI